MIKISRVRGRDCAYATTVLLKCAFTKVGNGTVYRKATGGAEERGNDMMGTLEMHTWGGYNGAILYNSNSGLDISLLHFLLW